MAAASMNDIKARMRSVSGTMQITKAMELVATSKLRRAKERAEASRRYREILSGALGTLSAGASACASPFLDSPADGKTVYVILAGDRGLAGGYNGNIFRLARDRMVEKENRLILPIGKKTVDYYRHRGEELVTDKYDSIGSIGVGDCLKIAADLSALFLTGKIAKVELIYTRFVSMMTVTPDSVGLLPLTLPEAAEDEPREPIVEGDLDALLASIVPEYLGGLLYTAVAEAFASECASRRTAMNSASKNAEEMIDALTLSYNRARQAVITQEITEIVSGAEAL